MAIENDRYWAMKAKEKEMAEFRGIDSAYDSHPMEPDQADPVEPSIEMLGEQWQSITDQVERLLVRREEIRQQFYTKHQMQRDMFEAISSKFDSQTGLDSKGMKQPKRAL